MDPFDSNNLKEAFRTLGKSTLSLKDKEDFLIRVCSILKLHTPDQSTFNILIHASMFSKLIVEIGYSLVSKKHEYKFFRQLIDFISAQSGPKKPKFFYFIRSLSVDGIYPNLELRREKHNYIIHQGQPLIVTPNHPKAEESFSDNTELSNLTRNEVKFLTCLSLLQPRNGLIMAVDESRPFIFPNTLFQEYSEIEILSAIGFVENLKFRLPINGQQRDVLNRNAYLFSVIENDYLNFFDNLMDSFSIRDHLLLRTSYYLLKGISLMRLSTIHGEDALANFLFTIEGALLLIQKRNKIKCDQINIPFLKSYFKSISTFGDKYYEFLEEGYEKRISIVHAHPKWGVKWTPMLFYEDILDYHSIAKELLSHILIDLPLYYGY